MPCDCLSRHYLSGSMIKDVIYISITHLLYVILTGEQKIRPGILLGDVGLDSPLGLHYLNEIQIAQGGGIFMFLEFILCFSRYVSY